jgi:acid stress chaperone HdeB
MKSAHIALSLAVALMGAAAAPSFAAADVLDLGTVKCKDFLNSGKEEIGYTLAWLDGYYMDEDASAIIDFDKLKTNAGKLGAYCGSHPEIGVGAAAEELFGK